MTDTPTLTVRDHSQPCEHGDESWAVLGRNGLWVCNWSGCPGGRERTFRQTDTMTLYMEQHVGKVLVEVDDV